MWIRHCSKIHILEWQREKKKTIEQWSYSVSRWPAARRHRKLMTPKGFCANTAIKDFPILKHWAAIKTRIRKNGRDWERPSLKVVIKIDGSEWLFRSSKIMQLDQDHWFAQMGSQVLSLIHVAVACIRYRMYWEGYLQNHIVGSMQGRVKHPWRVLIITWTPSNRLWVRMWMSISIFD